MSANNNFGIPKQFQVEGQSTNQTLKAVLSIGGTGFGVVVNPTVVTYRLGDRLIGQFTLTTGTTSAALAWIQLPPGLTINTQLVGVTVAAKRLGLWTLVSTGAAANIASAGNMGALFCDGTSVDRLYFAYRTSSGTYGQDVASGIFGTGVTIDCTFDLPIAQWVQ